jgi:N-acyl amino acid synthase of PEP-CTERM/exosortase system
MNGAFRPATIDDSPLLLEQSYRLRYQVYCLERKFLRAEDYPDEREIDEFDGDSVHVGALNSAGDVVGAARLVRAGAAGLPLLHHCTLFPDETLLDDVGNTAVEVSRVCISRSYARRQGDSILGGPVPSEPVNRIAALSIFERRKRRAEPFVTLLKAIVNAARREGATHLIGATDAALHRWLVHYGFPYRLAGPEVDYYGLVAPHIMSLAEFDQVVLGGKFEVLDGFAVGMDSESWPKTDEHDMAAVPASLR